MRNSDHYEAKVRQEVARFREVTNVHDLPDSFHYWSNKYLLPKLRPFGFDNSQQFYLNYMSRSCAASPGEECFFVSVGSGNCEIEVTLAEKLLAMGCKNFRLECLDVNSYMLERGATLAREREVTEQMEFQTADINAWHSARPYKIVIANHALHHFVELETLFQRIYDYLENDGYFLTHDMIGRNGHMRWPEALGIVQTLWQKLPESYKYNHQLKRAETEFVNWDCSQDGFEGIRSQDILPLLCERFFFELFVAWGGVIDVFVERSFGHNFDIQKEWDRHFIDEAQKLNEEALQSGLVKPTQMIAALTKSSLAATREQSHLLPRFCIRWPQWSE